MGEYNENAVKQFIPAEDFGILYGYSLFETFIVDRESKVFLLNKHMQRLCNSMEELFPKTESNPQELETLVLEYINRNEIKNRVLRMTVSCGNPSRDIDRSIIFTERDIPDNSAKRNEGLRLRISIVRKNEVSPTIRHKTSNYLENYLLLQKSLKDGFDDEIFLNLKGELTETTKSNIFFLIDGVLHTPSIECGILPGVIREWVLEEAKSKGIPVKTGSYAIRDATRAEEVFVTNSVIGLLPVKSIGEHVFNIGSVVDELTAAWNNSPV